MRHSYKSRHVEADSKPQCLSTSSSVQQRRCTRPRVSAAAAPHGHSPQQPHDSACVVCHLGDGPRGIVEERKVVQLDDEADLVAMRRAPAWAMGDSHPLAPQAPRP
eukprot:6177428-Pleurochrysis_carterae.AAC.1